MLIRVQNNHDLECELEEADFLHTLHEPTDCNSGCGQITCSGHAQSPTCIACHSAEHLNAFHWGTVGRSDFKHVSTLSITLFNVNHYTEIEHLIYCYSFCIHLFAANQALHYAPNSVPPTDGDNFV